MPRQRAQLSETHLVGSGTREVEGAGAGLSAAGGAPHRARRRGGCGGALRDGADGFQRDLSALVLCGPRGASCSMAAGSSAAKAGPASHRRMPCWPFGRWRARGGNSPGCATSSRRSSGRSSPRRHRRWRDSIPTPIRCAVEGLAAEMRVAGRTDGRDALGRADPHLRHCALRGPGRRDDRLGHLWEYVATRLGEPW